MMLVNYQLFVQDLDKEELESLKPERRPTVFFLQNIVYVAHILWRFSADCSRIYALPKMYKYFATEHHFVGIFCYLVLDIGLE